VLVYTGDSIIDATLSSIIEGVGELSEKGMPDEMRETLILALRECDNEVWSVHYDLHEGFK
jgi:hypothetical protein